MSKNQSPIGGFYPTTSNTSSNSSGTSSGTSSQSPDPYAAYVYGTVLNNALGAAATPYQPYEGQMVAGFTPSQIAAQQGFQNSVGMSTPYYTAAQNLYNQGLNYQANAMLPTASNYYWQGAENAYNTMTPLSQSYYSQAINTANPANYNVEPYMNPYQQQVVDATMNQLADTQRRATGQNTQQSVLRGSYGGSGQFLGQSEIARQQGLNNAQILGQLNTQNYQNAQQQYNQQMQNQMQAYQAAGQQLGALGYQNAAMKTQALQNAAQGLGSLGSSEQAQAAANIQNLASGMGALGTQSQQSYLQALAALSQSGAQQQQLQQQQLANAYQQYLQAKAYPYQQASYLGGLASGLGPLFGSTAAQQGSQNSSGSGSQIGMQPYQNQSGGGGFAGGLTSLLGLGLKAFMPGFKDGGRVSGRKSFGKGGSAEDDTEDFGELAGKASPYAGENRAAGNLGSLIGQQPYASRGGNYATEALKLAKIIPSAQQVSTQLLQKKIAEAITGIPQHGEVAPVSREITSSFFGAQEPSSSGSGGEEYSRRSSRKRDSEESESSDTEKKKDTGGFGDLFSGMQDGFSSLFNSEPGGFLASGGRVHRDAGGAATAPQGLSPDEAKNYVTTLYKTQLGRQGDPAGIDYWTNRLTQGLDTRDQVSRGFAGSAEYNKTPPNAANFVANLYKTQLGRQGDQSGFDYWTNKLQAGEFSKDDVYSHFAYSPESQAKISGLYQKNVNRAPDSEGLTSAIEALRSGVPFSVVEKSMPGASEAQKVSGYRQNIQDLYQSKLGREGETSGVNFWTGQLQKGDTPEALGQIFSTSPEAKKRLTTAYEQAFGQTPSGDQLGSWVNQLGESAQSLAGVTNNMITSPMGREYNRTHPGIQGSPARMSPKTINDLMETAESKAINAKMNPTGRSGAGFEALMAQAYENAPGPQFSPVQQGMQAMPDQSYYTKPQPSYLPKRPLIGYPQPEGDKAGTPPTPILGYLGLSQSAPGQDPTDFVKNLYSRYTGAGPSDEQLQKAVDAINGGTTRQSIETDLAKSTPAQNRAYLTELYNQTFNRPPDPAGLNYWADQLNKGMPAEDVLAEFGRSAERDATSVVQGYFPTIQDTRINPYTGLANLSYVAPYKSQRVPYMAGYKDGGRVHKKAGGSFDLYDPAIDKIAKGIAAIESGGRYNITGARSKRGDLPYGKYQIMGANIPKWGAEAGYPGLTPAKFLANPKIQEDVARTQFVKIYGRSGDPTHVAGEWLGGPGWRTNKHADVLGTNVPTYIKRFSAAYNGDPKLAVASASGAPSSGSIMLGNAPSSQGADKSPAPKSLQLSDLIENIIAPSLAGQQEEQPKLAKAPSEPIIPLTPMPAAPVVAMDDLGDEQRGKYLDKAIAMNERARGGRLHFADGGTDEDYAPLNPDRGTREYRSYAQYGQPSLSAQKSRNAFLREQLEGSAPQYDEAAGNEALDKYGNLGLDAGLGIMALSGVGAPLAAGLSALKNAYRFGRRFEKNGEPGFGGLIESRPQAPRGRQPSPAGEPIPMGIKTKPGMNRFESNTEGMRRNIPGNEIFQWSSLRDPKGSRPMNKFEENQANLNWNRFGQYEPNKAPAYYDKFGNVAPPKVNYDGVSQRPMSRFESNREGMRVNRPGDDLYLGSNARGPIGFNTIGGKPVFSTDELGQSLATQGGRGMTLPPSMGGGGGGRPPATQTGGMMIPPGGGGGGRLPPEPPYADYRDVTGNVLSGPGGGGRLPPTPPRRPGTGTDIIPYPGGGGRAPRNTITKTALSINGGPTIPPGMGDLPPFNPNITSDMPTPKLTDYYRVDRPVSAEDKPRAKRATPRRAAAPQDNRRYWGDWRDTPGFAEDPIGNFLDSLTGDRKVARKPGTIKSPMSPYAGEGSIHFAQGGRAYRDEGGFLGGLGDVLGKGIENLRSSKRSPVSEGLITAGLGMMASPQHNTLRAIGEGGLRGIQAYNTSRDQQREDQKLLDQQRIDTDFATKTMDELRKLQRRSAPNEPSVSSSDSEDNSSNSLFPNISISPIIKRNGGSVRRAYAQGGQPQQDEGFDPFEAIGAVGDTIGSGLQSLGDTIGSALMPSAQAEEAPAKSAPRRSSRSPVADGLITAGLGMMASPAHNTLRAIGEGGLRGIQEYNTSAEEQRKEDKLEEQRLENEKFSQSLLPKAPTAPKIEKTAAQETPVIAQDRTEEDPIETTRRQLDYLSSVVPKNATQEKILTRLINQKKYELSGNIGILDTDEFGIPRRGYISGPRAGTPLSATQPGATPAVPKDLHGEGFLELLPSTDFANTVKSIAEGRSKMPTGPRAAKVRAAVLQYDPDYREARYDVIQSASKTTGNNLGATINSGNTAIKHLGEASDAIKDLAKTELAGGKYPMANWLEQKIKPGLFGYEELKRLETAKERFAEEATKFYRGVGGAEADVKRSMDRLNAAQTPAELNAILDEEMALFSGKVLGVRSVYDTAFKSPYVKYDEFEPITDESKNYVEMIKGRSPKKFTHTIEEKKQEDRPSAPSSQNYVEGEVYTRGDRSFMYKNGRFVEVKK